MHRHMASITSSRHSFKSWVLDHKSDLNLHSPLASLGFTFNLIIHAPVLQYFPPLWRREHFSWRHRYSGDWGHTQDMSFKPNKAGLLFLHSWQLHCETLSWRMGGRLKAQGGSKGHPPTHSQFSRSRTPSWDWEAGAGGRQAARRERAPNAHSGPAPLLWASFSTIRHGITGIDDLSQSDKYLFLISGDHLLTQA